MALTDKELVNIIRAALKEELKPINKKLDNLEKGQKEIKKELREVWQDIQKLDKRLTVQERKAL